MANTSMGDDFAEVHGEALPYEPPVLTPIGSLHDLLAGSGSLACDNHVIQKGPTAAIPTPPFCP
jgi:hypothetical protein